MAFVATVYGVGAANILFLPSANKLHARIERARPMKELVLEGVDRHRGRPEPHPHTAETRGFQPGASAVSGQTASEERKRLGPGRSAASCSRRGLT